MSSSVLTAPRAPIARTRPEVRPGFWSRAWTALEAYGERRAATEIRRIALTHFAHNPEIRGRLLAAAAGDTPAGARR